MLVVAVVGALANLAGLLVLRRAQAKSLNMRGAYLEVLGDLMGSVAVIVAAVLILITGWTIFDAIASLAIVVLIIPRAWSLLREVVDVLLGGDATRASTWLRCAITSSGYAVWSTCTTCMPGRSPAAYRCCPRTSSSTTRASARVARARCSTGSANASADTSMCPTARSSSSRSATRSTRLPITRNAG